MTKNKSLIDNQQSINNNIHLNLIETNYITLIAHTTKMAQHNHTFRVIAPNIALISSQYRLRCYLLVEKSK